MNSIVRRSPLRSLSLWDELNNWDDFLSLSSASLTSIPSIDITEDEKAYSVRADIPDYEKEDITVNLEDGELTISGQKRKDENEEKKNYIKKERLYSRFEKTIRLNEQIDTDNIKASLKNGVLELNLPKKEIKKIDKKRINVE